MNRGKLTILGMLALAVLLGGYAWWYSYNRGRRIKQVWGTRASLLIERAPTVELLELEPVSVADGGTASDETSSGADEEADRLPLGLGCCRVVRRRDISRLRGLIHARHWLVEDVHFYWDRPPSSAEPIWRFALRFSDGPDHVTLAFAPRQARIRMTENGKEVETGEMIERMTEYLEPQLNPAAETPSAGSR